MVGFQQALSGRKVYGQGSFAPTKGRVSANGMQGYLQRTQRQQLQPGGVRRVGGDGQSDTRSGLAQAAMQRRAAGAPTKTPYNNQGRRPVGKGARGGGSASAAAAVTNGSQSPQVMVNNNGQLELPYSPAWSQELIQSMGQYNQDLGTLQSDQQQEALAYNQANRQEGQHFVGQQRNSLNTAAGGGTAFSSAYGVQASNDANEHQNTINQLLAEHNAQSTAFDTERTAIINAFKAQMQQRALQYADEVAQNAGTLGYGQAKGERRKGKNSSAYTQAAQQAVRNQAARNGGNGGRRGSR